MKRLCLYCTTMPESASIICFGTFMGAFVGTVERAARLASEGYRYLAVSGDVGMLVNGARNLVKSLHEAIGE